MARTFIKDPDAVLDYTLDWDQGWLDTGDSISVSTWTRSPIGITIDSSGNTTTTATITISGGTHGESYMLKNKVVTANALTGERTIRITAWDPR
jgi:hypothetical protein